MYLHIVIDTAHTSINAGNDIRHYCKPNNRLYIDSLQLFAAIKQTVYT